MKSFITSGPVLELTKCFSEKQIGKTLMRLLLQEQSGLGLRCLSRPFWQATNVQNFRTSTIIIFHPVIISCLETYKKTLHFGTICKKMFFVDFFAFVSLFNFFIYCAAKH